MNYMKKFSVSEFVEFLNSALSAAVFPDGVVVEGEVTEYRVSQGKWIWFLLKDEKSSVSCFSMTWKLRQPLEDGMQVRVFGVPKVHAKSGKFSVVVDRVEPIGEGALRRAYELLKRNLEKEGLFDVARKRPLPRFPGRIGLIASRESAAYSDFLRILGNRWGGLEINSVHVQVQGKQAVQTITDAFEYFNRNAGLADVLVLTRGGGSLEDLHAFNSEDVARAIFGSKIPVVVGVGHERDESLADFVADVRASTPSNAAELIVPDRAEVMSALENRASFLVSAMEGQVSERKNLVSRSVQSMDSALLSSLSVFRHRLRDFAEAFERYRRNVEEQIVRCDFLTAQLTEKTGSWLDRTARELESKQKYLHSYNPKNVLKRGYAIVRHGDEVLREWDKVKTGDDIDVQLHEGHLSATVTGKNSD